VNASKLESEIEKALVEDPTHTEGFAVYADFLQQKGDPRGELIACQIKASKEAKRRAAQLLDEHARDLLGIFADWEDEAPLQVDWRCGFFRWARLYVNRRMEDSGFDQATLTKALLSLPSSRFIEELELGCGSIHESRIPERVNEALIEHGPFKTLRKLSLVTDQEEEMLSWTAAGDLGHLSKTAPNLTALCVEAGSLELGEPKMKNLEELVIETCGFSVENAESIASARWPALRKMVLWFGSRSYGVEIPVEAVEKMLEKKRFPSLVHLGLCNNDLTDELIDLLAENPLLPQLKTLDLSKGTLSDAGAERMIELAPRFKHLAEIDLSSNFVHEAAAPLKKALKQVDLGKFPDAQREAEEYDGEVLRYADVGE
jgi:uncharacterized protein (TIGR02996 family)